MAEKHYVRKEIDDSLTYIGLHAAKPREAFGPAIPDELIDEKYNLKFKTTTDDFGFDVIVFEVDEVKKAARLEAEAAEAAAQEAARLERETRRTEIADFKSNIATLTLPEVKDLLVKVLDELNL